VVPEEGGSCQRAPTACSCLKEIPTEAVWLEEVGRQKKTIWPATVTISGKASYMAGKAGMHDPEAKPETPASGIERMDVPLIPAGYVV
jgi:hypothetical protein